MTKKTSATQATSARVIWDLIIFCAYCPGHTRKQVHAHAGPTPIHAPSYGCDLCSKYFAEDAKVLHADTAEANAELKTRLPKVLQWKLDRAGEKIAAKDHEIEKLKDRVESYERAMTMMGGAPRFRGPFGMPY